MNDNYKKALAKVKQGQENMKCYNCCYQIIDSNNSIVGPTGPQGVMGPTGPQGVQGIQGIQGPTGATGAQGMPGQIGPTGPAGTSVTILGSYANLNDLLNEHNSGNIGDSYLVGDDLYVWSDNTKSWQDVGVIRGPQGVMGPPGEIGEMGPIGPKGEQGVQGLQGIMGPTGPTGPASQLNVYGGKYNNITDTLDTSLVGTWVEVPLIENMDSLNINNSISNAITILENGVYEINYGLNITTDKSAIITLMVRENSVIIPSTVITKNIISNTAASFNGSTIISLMANDTLDLVVSATEDNVIINFGPGITAYLSIKKIDSII